MIEQDKKDLKTLIVLFKAHKALLTFIKNDLKGTGFTLNEFAVFEVIYHKKSLTVNEIKDKVLVASSSLTYILDQLEKRKLIVRVKNNDDRRVNEVSLTKKGNEVASTILPLHYQNLKEVFAHLDEKTNSFLIAELKEIGFKAALIGKR